MVVGKRSEPSPERHQEKKEMLCLFHDLIFPLGLDLQKWKIIIFFTITYITSNSIQLCLFRISKRVIVIVYVIVEVIDFVVATKRDAKSVTIPDETGKAR